MHEFFGRQICHAVSDFCGNLQYASKCRRLRCGLRTGIVVGPMWSRNCEKKFKTNLFLVFYKTNLKYPFKSPLAISSMTTSVGCPLLTTPNRWTTWCVSNCFITDASFRKLARSLSVAFSLTVLMAHCNGSASGSRRMVPECKSNKNVFLLKIVQVQSNYPNTPCRMIPGPTPDTGRSAIVLPPNRPPYTERPHNRDSPGRWASCCWCSACTICDISRSPATRSTWKWQRGSRSHRCTCTICFLQCTGI